MTRSYQRSGMTLMEVMFAIGVATIGVLSLTALIVFAGGVASRGRDFDNVAILGKAASQQFEIIGANNAEHWVFADGTAVNSGSLPAKPLNTYPQSWCIDPIFCADNPTVTTFPAVAANYTMPRVTLRTARAGVIGRTTLGMSPMNALAAHHYCTLSDQLVMQPLTDEQWKYPNTRYQKYSTIMGAETKRQYEGDFSWFAMVTPRIDATWGNNFGAFYTPNPDGSFRTVQVSEYSVSVVVVKKRSVNMTPIPGEPFIEQVYAVDRIDGAGYRGGVMVFEEAAQNDLPTLSEGTWVMLSGEIPPIPGPLVDSLGNPNPRPAPIPIHRWYNVVSGCKAVDAIQNSSGDYEVSIALDGPDWQRDSMPNPQLTVIKGAVAVYERTMRIDGTGLWRN